MIFLPEPHALACAALEHRAAHGLLTPRRLKPAAQVVVELVKRGSSLLPTGRMTMTSHKPIELTGDHRMLLRMRDTLYEGVWADFSRDLRARINGKPHVFETVPTSAAMRETITNHLAMIAEMDEWEQAFGHPLSADAK